MTRVKEKILLKDLISCFKTLGDHKDWKSYQDKGITCRSILFCQKMFLEELLNFYNNDKDAITPEEIGDYHIVIEDDINTINKLDNNLRPINFELPVDNTVLSCIITSRSISDSMARESFLDSEIVTYFKLLSELLTNMSCYCYKNEGQTTL